jgi:hypothetical protein
MRMMRMHHPSPQWLGVDGLHPHLAQQNGGCKVIYQEVMVFHPKEGESCSADRRNTWTLGGIAIDQVST